MLRATSGMCVYFDELSVIDDVLVGCSHVAGEDESEAVKAKQSRSEKGEAARGSPASGKNNTSGQTL